MIAFNVVQWPRGTGRTYAGHSCGLGAREAVVRGDRPGAPRVKELSAAPRRSLAADATSRGMADAVRRRVARAAGASVEPPIFAEDRA